MSMQPRNYLLVPSAFLLGLLLGVAAGVFFSRVNVPMPTVSDSPDREKELSDTGPGSGSGSPSFEKPITPLAVKESFSKPKGALPLGAAGLPAAAVRDYLADQDGWNKVFSLTLNYKVLRLTSEGAGEPTKWTGHYQYDVNYKGVPIAKASRALAIIADKPVFVRDRNIPADASKFDPPDATVDPAAARLVAFRRSALDVSRSTRDRKVGTLAPASSGLAGERRVYWVGEGGRGRLAWEFLVPAGSRSAPTLRRYWVSARGQPDILASEDLIGDPVPPRRILEKKGGFRGGREPARPAQANTALPQAVRPHVAMLTSLLTPLQAAAPPVGTRGVVTGTIWPGTPFGGVEHKHPLSHIEVRLLKAGATPETTVTKTAVTNEHGEYFFFGVTGDVQVSATLTGPYARVMAGPDADASLQVAKAGNGRIDLDFRVEPGDEEHLSQVSAFCWVNEARDFAAEFLTQPSNRLAKLRIFAFADGEGESEGYWLRTNNTITLQRSTGDLPNKAYRDVIFHEYGHALDNQWGEIQGLDYSEGFGDAFSILLTRKSVIGKDYNGAGSSLRDAAEVHKWPDALNGDKYDRGLVYAGFVWELIAQLKEQFRTSPDAEEKAYGVAKQLILDAAHRDPESIPHAVRLSFVYDSEQYKGAAGGKSRHFDALAAAARSRGLEVPADPAKVVTALFK